MSQPYASSALPWLQENEAFFREVLEAASRHAAHLRHLKSVFSPAGQHMLDFVDISDGELEAALRVASKLMDGLGPTANAMREEIDQRKRKRLPIARGVITKGSRPQESGDPEA